MFSAPNWSFLRKRLTRRLLRIDPQGSISTFKRNQIAMIVSKMHRENLDQAALLWIKKQILLN